jgi:hypothetical protein
MICTNSHAMTQAMAEFAVATIVGSAGAVGQVSVIAVVVRLRSVARQGTTVSGIYTYPSGQLYPSE